MKFIFKILVLAVGVIGIKSELDWWERANFYQIYPRSFMDSDGDGVGDLKGITSKLNYLKNLGVDAAWLSPIMKSPMADFGYDISDYLTIQPEYGTNDDLYDLVAKANAVGLKIILDFVPNHTSDEHDWFIQSELKNPDYIDYYVWHPGKPDPANPNGRNLVPNNWVSVFRFSAWQWSEIRGEYYLHQFAVKQPDLNYRNAKVVEEMKNVLRFWLGKGIAGFRIDAVPFLFEVAPDADGNYPDEELAGIAGCDDKDNHCYLKHTLTQDLDETFDMAYQWRAVLDQFKVDNPEVPTKVMLTEAYTTLKNTMRFYSDGNGREGSHVPFNFELINHMVNSSSASDFKDVINSWLSELPTGRISNWVMGNHDNKRLASRFGTDRADLLNILLNTLPGIAVTYNGEELAMTDVYIPWADTVDPQACNTNSTVFNTYSRDPARTPFQWDDSVNSGFSSGSKTWLPVSADYKTNNVKLQESALKSHLKVFRRLVALRKEQILREGTFEDKVYLDNVYMYKREIANQEVVIVVLNFSRVNYLLNLKSYFKSLPTSMEIITASISSRYNEGDIVSSNSVNIQGGVGVVFHATYLY